MKDLIDELSELIYVVDPDTYKLEFINETGKRTFGIDQIENLKCYEALYGKSAPCEFCNNSRLSEENFITWECDNPKVNRHYLLRDSLIDWNGKKAKVEIACDITQQELQKTKLREMLDGQNIILDCVRIMHDADNILDVLGSVVERIGGFANAQRAYIYESCKEEGVEGTQVWYHPDTTVSRTNVQDECRLAWRRRAFFKDQDCVALRDIQVIQDKYPREYRLLKSKKISNLVTAPLELEKNCIGYLELDNVPADKIAQLIPLTGTLAYFISSCMCICKSRRRLERLSYMDSLTGVMNRNAYQKRLSQLETDAGCSIGVLYIDINDMKGINDRFGHAFGDHILVDLSERIAAYFKREEIFRIDGDEFVVICQDKQRTQFGTLAQSFLSSVREQRDYVVSAGYQWSEKQEGIRDLIAASDRMMYDDKKGFYFERPMPRHCRYQYDEIKELLNPDILESKLAAGKFSIYFQPKMTVHDRGLIGAEALIRYHGYDGRIVSPDRFIPLLEERRLINMVDFYVFEAVCRQLAHWKKQKFRLVPVSVNFSRYSLMDVDFLERLERIAAAYKVEKRLLEIEVTESADTSDGFDFLGRIEKIRKAGFSVSIDDFGVQYANLFLFTTVDFDVLKIDKSLARDLVSNEKARAILRSISDICKRMHISMIVEGIETENQLQILEDIDCYGVQGYYFSRPIPVPEFEKRYMKPNSHKESA